LKYATRELARRRGALATFMAKPFAEHAGNSMHLHLSRWHDGEPAFTPGRGTESPLMRQAVGGILTHMPHAHARDRRVRSADSEFLQAL
jgi:glutamine synthetase